MHGNIPRQDEFFAVLQNCLNTANEKASRATADTLQLYIKLYNAPNLCSR